MSTLRPNTTVQDEVLRRDVILCCGEDEQELLLAARRVDQKPEMVHRYRCYCFWNIGSSTLILTGIGTGCLEPLLFEILGGQRVERIVLVGTAGATPLGQKTLVKGNSYIISTASLFAAAVRPISDTPYTFRWSSPLRSHPTATIVSTDYYYGFGTQEDSRSGNLRRNDRELSKGFASIIGESHLVDMETGQFYHFCSIIAPISLNFIAIKGPANLVQQC